MVLVHWRNRKGGEAECSVLEGSELLVGTSGHTPLLSACVLSFPSHFREPTKQEEAPGAQCQGDRMRKTCFCPPEHCVAMETDKVDTGNDLHDIPQREMWPGHSPRQGTAGNERM